MEKQRGLFLETIYSFTEDWLTYIWNIRLVFEFLINLKEELSL